MTVDAAKMKRAANAYITPNGCRPALAIFPCRPGDKTPLLSKSAGGNGCKDATSDGEQIAQWWTDYPTANIGLATGEINGILVIDVDCGEGKHGDESLAELEHELGKLPDTWISLTAHGGQHLIFRYPKGHNIHNSAGVLADNIDIRANGGYIVAPPSALADGSKYEWDAGFSPNDTELAEIPTAWLDRIANATTKKTKAKNDNAAAEKFKIPESISNGQRNETLFKYCISLRQQGVTASDILTMLKAANVDRCDTPLPTREISSIYDSAMSYDIKVQSASKARFYCDKKFMHNLLGDYLLENYGVCIINNALHIYDGGIYREGFDALQGIMLELIPDLTIAKRREVYEYLKASTKTPRKDRSPANLIPFKSQIYNIDTDEFINYSPEYVFLNRFPYDYKPNAELSEPVLNTLAAIADYDGNVVDLLLEAFGNCFYMKNVFRGAVLLYGASGSNGKSTLLNMLGQMLGAENVSSLSLQDTAERFRLIGVYGKAANIGDDISGAYFTESAIFKKLVTGESVTAERKGQDPIDFRSYAKLFFACNELPPIRDKSDAFFSRIILIPLEHDFSKAGRDVTLKDRRWTEADMEYLVSLSIDALKKLLNNGDFTRPQAVVDILAEYKTENDPVLQYIEDVGASGICGKPSSVVYADFVDFCQHNGNKSIQTKVNFSRAICKALNITTIQKKVNGTNLKVFSEKMR